MADFLNSWIVGIICTSMLCALVISITPKGKAYSAVKLLCAIAMIFSIISPVAKLNFNEYSSSLEKYREKADEAINSASEYDDNLNRLFIQDKSAAYILDKADNSGIELNGASVEAEWSTEGYWYPYKAKISGNCSGDAKNKLSAWIESELGIAKERQEWTNE